MDTEFECTACHTLKPSSQFPKNNQIPKGVGSQCLACKAKKEADRKAAYRAAGVMTRARDEARYAQARKLGLSIDDYTALIIGPCSVCDERPYEGGQSHSVYQRSVDGSVIGVLCRKCSSAAGFLGRDATRATRLAVLLSDQRLT